MIIKMNHIPLTDIADSLFFPEEAKETVKEWAKEKTQEAIMGALEAVKEVLIDLSFSLALVGGVLCILFWVVGWKEGKRWAAILFLANVLIKLLIGGGTS